VVLVQLCEQSIDLPLAKGIVENVIDALRCDAQPRRGYAIDYEFRL
jgi:hypothetical protein